MRALALLVAAAILALQGCAGGHAAPATAKATPASTTAAASPPPGAATPAAKGKPTPTPTPKPTPPPPKTTTVLVGGDCRVDHPTIELSRAGAERIHWALEGGISVLAIQLKDPTDADKVQRWANDVVVRCPGTAECWAQVTPKAGIGDRHEYRVTIDAKACPDPLVVIEP